MRSKNRVGKIYLGFVLFILYAPIFFLIFYAFNEGGDMNQFTGFTLDNFKELFQDSRLILIVVILALIGWAGFARVVRGMVLSIKNQEFVQSAKMVGASNLRIIIREILPQTTSYVIVAMTLSVPSYILSESGLSFLGLGIQQPDASWGNMLKEAQEYINILYRPWLLTPGFLIFVAVLSFNLIGDTIRDVLDPKSRMR